MSDSIIKFSVITVCFNAKNSIEKTMRSVLDQDYPSIEYIIIDGKSGDGTTEIIEKIIGENKNEKVEILYTSEKDNGIYDAMNKGVQKASGDYIQFLNSGDSFIDNSILKKVSERVTKGEFELLYSNIRHVSCDRQDEDRLYTKICGKSLYFLTGDSINHQGIFASKKCFEKDFFDDKNYKICADREWLMRMFERDVHFVCLGFTTVNYCIDDDSASVRFNDVKWIEAEKCIREHYPVGKYIYLMFKWIRAHNKFAKLMHSFYEYLFIR